MAAKKVTARKVATKAKAASKTSPRKTATARRRPWENAADVVRDRVPSGKVTTYGDIAVALDLSRGTGGRAVGQMMSAWERADPDGNLTHRVVEDNGLVPDHGLHHERLEAEGVRIGRTGRVDLRKHRATL